MIESDGITLLDFKSDFVSDDTILASAERYTEQVDTYAKALEKIYKCPVKEKLLYFFAADQFLHV